MRSCGPQTKVKCNGKKKTHSIDWRSVGAQSAVGNRLHSWRSASVSWHDGRVAVVGCFEPRDVGDG
jgi:hypothetical protein